MKPKTKKDTVMQLITEAGNITNNMKVKIYFTLTEFSTTKIVTWGFHMNDSDKVGYNKVLGRDILTTLVLNIKILNISLNQVTYL